MPGKFVPSALQGIGGGGMTENLDILNTAVSLVLLGGPRSAARQRLFTSAPYPAFAPA